MKRLKPYLLFSALGGGIMLATMLMGEWLHGPIFNGFLHKPHLWFFAFLETIIWIIPLTALTSVFINKLPNMGGAALIASTMGFWVGLAVSVFMIYQLFSDSRLPLWSEATFGLPYVFGWYLPGIITILLLSLLAPVVFQTKQGK